MPMSDEDFDQVCEQVSAGDSVAASLRRLKCSFGYFYDAVDLSDKRRERYARARKLQAEAHVSLISEVGRDVLNGELDPNAARVAIDAMKWCAARLHPAVYGDKVQTEHSGQVSYTVGWAEGGAARALPGPEDGEQ